MICAKKKQCLQLLYEWKSKLKTSAFWNLRPCGLVITIETAIFWKPGALLSDYKASHPKKPPISGIDNYTNLKQNFHLSSSYSSPVYMSVKRSMAMHNVHRKEWKDNIINFYLEETFVQQKSNAKSCIVSNHVRRDCFGLFWPFFDCTLECLPKIGQYF